MMYILKEAIMRLENNPQEFARAWKS